MIRRPPRSTRKESSAASDVYKRQHADSPPRVRHLYLKDYGRDTFAVGDIDLPSGTTAPLCGSGDLATLGLGEPPPCPRVYISSRHAALAPYSSCGSYAGALRLTSYVLRRVFLSTSSPPTLRLLRCGVAGFYSRFRLHLLLRRLGTVGSSSAEYAANEQRFSRALKSDTGGKSTAQ